RVAQHAEALGYHSLWVFQRLLYALAPKNPYPPAPGPMWPASFQRVMDPIVTLAYVAAATTRIRLGTSVLIMPYYSPVLLAKQLRPPDVVPRGRLHAGLGIGWSIDEYDAVGVPYRQRGKRADEFLRCLKAAWTEERVEFHGEFYRIPKAKVEPKPVQRPHPPITIGGYGPAVVKPAVPLADGFNGGNMPRAPGGPRRSGGRSASIAAGRDPATLHIVCRGTFLVHPSPQGKARRPLFGTLDEIREDIARYAEAGLTELFLEGNFQPDGARLEEVLRVMEALAP